jgi:DNA repair protein RecO (recombination protein O)
MDETFATKGIILKREPYKEVDSRVFVYTPDQGKMELLARGTQKPGSKLAAHIEPLNVVDMLVVRGKNKKYLGSAIARDCQAEIKNDFAKVFWSGRAINVFNSLVREDHEDVELFYLLQDFLKAMGRVNDQEELYCHYFYLKLLSALGYRPELNNCQNCQQKIIAGKNHFVFSRGGLICDQCFEEIRAASLSVVVSDNCLKLLRQVLLLDFYGLSRLIVNQAIADEFKSLALAILNYNKG